MEKMEKTSNTPVGKHVEKKPGKAEASRSSETSARRRPANAQGTSEKKDAFDFLKEQHREVKQLFSEFEEAEDDGAALAIARTIAQKLTLHATIEEEIFYPAARGKKALEDAVLEALEEHLSVKRLIADIEEAHEGDETLDAKLAVLEEQVTHHVKEEETELFPRAKKEFPKEEREAMGQQLRARAEALAADDEDDGEDRVEAERPAARDGVSRNATRH